MAAPQLTFWNAPISFAVAKSPKYRNGHPDRLPDLTQAEIERALREMRKVKGRRVDEGKFYLDERTGKVGVRVYKEA